MLNENHTYLLELLQNEYEESFVTKILYGYSQRRMTTFRINTIKANEEEVLLELNKFGFIVKPVTWYKNAFIIMNQPEKNIRELEIYQNGLIYLQSLSSMIPVIALDPKEKEDILDMTAAPGSKTTQIAMETKNKAFITACEKNNIRQQRLKYNLEKQGVTCCTVLNMDAREIDESFSFHKILLDAPCSGSGTINENIENPNQIISKEQMAKITSIQLALLRKALKILKPGGTLVYSTCSILKEENEQILKTVWKEFSIEIIPLEIKNNDFTLLPTDIPGTLCICPDKFYEGFFIALLKKNV